MPFSRGLVYLTALSVMSAQIPPSAPPAGVVIKTTSRIVNVNVVAVDGKGKPVTDLAKEDFIVKDAGKERPISLFSLERTDSAAPAAPATPLPPATFSNHLEESTAGVTIFLFDGLNTRFEDQARAKAQLIKYLREVDVKDRVALFALGKGLFLLHDFTTDTQSMIDTLNRRGPRINTEVADAEPEAANSGDADLDKFLDNANQQFSDYTNVNRATTTAAALEAIAGHAARIPGRKNLVWVSGGFPVSIGFDTAAKPGIIRDQRTFSPEISRATRALNEANLAVYPVDARGLQTFTPTAASRPPVRGAAPAGATPIDTNYDSMEVLAQATGGRAFHNLNDLASAIKLATSDARVSYALAFSPPQETLDGKYHELKIETKRSGVHLRFRKGYFASPETPQPSLEEAILSPSAFTGVGIMLNFKTVQNDVVATITVDPKNITVAPGSDGKWLGAIQILVFSGVFPKDLKPRAISLSFSPEGFEKEQKVGLVMTAKIALPKGPFEYHIGVRDVPSGAVGTLHVFKAPALK